MRTVLAGVLVLMLVPVTASAVTVQEIVRLSKAGVSDEVILTLIERDRTIFAIDAEQLMVLRDSGVSEAIVLAMLRSGRQEQPPTMSSQPVQSAPYAAPPAPPVESGPIVGVVGHGPDRPNAPQASDPYGGLGSEVATYGPPPYGIPYGVPILIPYPIPVRERRFHHVVPVIPQSLGVVPMTTGPVVPLAGPGFVSVRGMFFNGASRPPVANCPRCGD